MTVRNMLVRMGLPALLVIILSVWVGRAMTSPEFALLGLKQACQSSDVELFNRYVDLQGVLSRATESLGDAQQSPQPQGLGAALAKTIKSELVAQAAEFIQQGVASGRFASTPPQTAPWLERLWLALSPTPPDWIKAVTVTDRLAAVDLALPLEPNKPAAQVRLLMRRHEASWQVVEIQKIDGLAQALGLTGLLLGK